VVQGEAEPPSPTPTPAGDPIGEGVRSALREVAPNIDMATLDPDADLTTGADLDSIDFLALMTRIHETTGVDIAERDFPCCTTLGGLVTYVRDRALTRQR
jgi:acyl carrier protein